MIYFIIQIRPYQKQNWSSYPGWQKHKKISKWNMSVILMQL